jgi:hypothetical protein
MLGVSLIVMQFSVEWKIGIALALLFGFGGGAAIRYPDQLWIGSTMMALGVIGGVWLILFHFGLLKRWYSRVTIALMSIAILVCSEWYFWPNRKDDSAVNHALMQLKRISPDAIGASDIYRVRVDLFNIGNLTARDTMSIFGATITSTPLSRDVIESNLTKFVWVLDEWDRGRQVRGTDIEPTLGQAIHSANLYSIDVDMLSSMEKLNSSILTVTPETWKSISDGKKLMYVLYAIRYGDDTVNGYWQTKGCVIYTGTADYVRKCADGKTEHIVMQRKIKK